jgi:hypothetical protein
MPRKHDKQGVADEIAALLRIPRDKLGNGSKEHQPFLQNIAIALAISASGDKHAVARRIVEALGGVWSRDCYSRGGSVQTHALLIIRDALRARIGTVRADFLVAVSDAEMRVKAGDAAPLGNPTPRRGADTVGDFIRCPQVVAWILMRAAGVCEACQMPAPFCRADGTPYLEVHHVQPLAEGGPDTVDNAVALCPNCHRAAHHSAKGRDLRRELGRRLLDRGYGQPKQP